MEQTGGGQLDFVEFIERDTTLWFRGLDVAPARQAVPGRTFTVAGLQATGQFAEPEPSSNRGYWRTVVIERGGLVAVTLYHKSTRRRRTRYFSRSYRYHSIEEWLWDSRLIITWP